MPSSRTMKYLHRIGYVCTALVAFEIVAFGALAVWGELQYRQFVALQMHDTSTQENALVPDGYGGTHDGAIRAFAALPPRPALAGDGFRFTAMPSFGPHWYAISLGGKGDLVAGTLAITGPHRDQYSAEFNLKFTMPRGNYARAMGRIDALADGFAGYEGVCMDGTPIAFERVRGNRVTSGSGSVGCNAHYRAISTAVLEMMRPYLVLPESPTGPDWMPKRAR